MPQSAAGLPLQAVESYRKLVRYASFYRWKE